MDIADKLELNITGYDINGLGICYIDNRIIFVEGAMQDEIVLAEITSVHKKYAFAKAIKIIKKSSKRIVPECPYFEMCGGCDLMHLPYDVECEIKENKVKSTLKKLLNPNSVNTIIRNDNINNYRNKVMIPFQRDEDDDVISGFYEKKTHNIISMDQCIISSNKANEIISFIRKYISVFHVSVYSEETHKGLFREVMVRHTINNEYMVVLICTAYNDFKGLIEYLNKDFPEIKSIYLNVNTINTNVLLTDEYHLLYGNKTIRETILGLDFNVSPASFMQVNHNNCEKLYSEAFRLANLNENMNVIDAYCGMGSITLNIAKQVKKVYGIEIVPEAIANANENKKLNSISNAEFICGKCEDEIVKLVNKENIDAIFFDPPRKGCDVKFLETVISMGIPKIIYISCNIATCARDIEILKNKGYELIEATPVDLFSRTSHVESVACLSLKDIHRDK